MECDCALLGEMRIGTTKSQCFSVHKYLKSKAPNARCMQERVLWRQGMLLIMAVRVGFVY